MKLDVSIIKWQKEIEKTISVGINNRWNELEYTWTVDTPTTTTTNYYTHTDGGTSGNFYWRDYSPSYLTTLSSSPF